MPIIFTTIAIAGITTGAVSTAALLYNLFKTEKTEEELNFEDDLADLSVIEKRFMISDSCIIRPSLTPNNTAKLPKNKVIIGKS